MKLGPEARMLVAAGRETDRPTAADRERVFSKLRGRIALPGPSPAGASSHPEVPSAAPYSRELRRAARR